jgi:hypothetical protein
MKMRYNILVLPVVLGLAACGTTGKLIPVSFNGSQSPGLTSAQRKVVSDGVREMVAKETVNGGEGAKLDDFRVFRVPSREGLQVCGHVSYQVEPGKPVISAPYYLELEELDGQPAAKRGQVGFDKLRKSKVTFMCRHVKVK